MEFKKCMRCGCFFISDDNVCCNCQAKDRMDIARLNNFLDENNTFSSIQELSNETGINISNINRFISENKINNFNVNL